MMGVLRGLSSFVSVKHSWWEFYEHADEETSLTADAETFLTADARLGGVR